jgi:hypothetical protein
MTSNGRRLTLCLLLSGGAFACSAEPRQPVEHPRATTALSGSEAEENYGDTTAVRDTTENLTPVVPKSDMPGEPGHHAPVATDGVASDTPGVLPGDMPLPPVLPIEGDKAEKPTDGDQVADQKPRKHDGEGRPLTASDQGTSKKDIAITKRIRESVLENNNLSFTAKNVKIITVDGRVTLSGAVRNQLEARAIEDAAMAVAGQGQVENQLQVR